MLALRIMHPFLCSLPPFHPLCCPSVSLLLAQPWTGRTHQIRVHLQHAGLPVAGDELYGALPLRWRTDSCHQPGSSRGECAKSPALCNEVKFTAEAAAGADSQNESAEGASGRAQVDIAKVPIITRQALHAWQLQLAHPVNGQILNLCAPPSDDIQQLAQACNLVIPEV